jgi:hypothetical protein
LKLQVATDDSYDMKMTMDTATRRLSLQQSEKRLVGGDQELGAKSNDEGDLDSETILRVAAHSEYGHKIEEASKRKSIATERSIEIPSSDSSKKFSNVVSTDGDSSISENKINPAKGGIKRYSDV